MVPGEVMVSTTLLETTAANAAPGMAPRSDAATALTRRPRLDIEILGGPISDSLYIGGGY